MDATEVTRLFENIMDTRVDVWPDLRLLSNLLRLSSEGSISGDFAVHWHQLDTTEDAEFARLFAPPRIPGFFCAGQGQGRTNPYCWLVWDEGKDASACGRDKLNAEKTTMKTRQPCIYECHAGLTDIAVPICAGENYLGTIITGQVHREPPSKPKFDKIWRKVRNLTYLDMELFYKAYMATPVISQESLQRTIETLMVIADHAARVWTKTERLLEQERRFERMRTYERKELIEELISGRRVDAVQMANRLKELGLTHLPTTAMVIRIDNLEAVGHGKPQSRREILFNCASNHVQDVIERMPDTLAAALVLGEITILTRPLQTRNPVAGTLMLRELGERTLDVLKKSAGLTAVVGIGRSHGTLAGLQESYQQAMEAVMRSDDARPRRIIHIDDLSILRGGRSIGGFWQLQEALCVAFKREDAQEKEKILGQIIGWLSANGHVSTVEQEAFMTSIAESLAEAALDAGCSPGHILDRKSRWFEELLRAGSTNRLRDWLNEVVDGLFEELRGVRMNRLSKLLASAVTYMDQNRGNKLSLEDVASHIGLSPSYFRHKFKEIRGVSFRHFQMQVRMREASRLLLDPQLSIADVAASLGYDNASQFARAFRKYMGATPREYRANPQV